MSWTKSAAGALDKTRFVWRCARRTLSDCSRSYEGAADGDGMLLAGGPCEQLALQTSVNASHDGYKTRIPKTSMIDQT